MINNITRILITKYLLWYNIWCDLCQHQRLAYKYKRRDIDEPEDVNQEKSMTKGCETPGPEKQ